MGCSTSKLDGLPAAHLCRDRCNFIEESLCRSYDLADSHAAYFRSLNTVGPAIREFFDRTVECRSSEFDSSSGSQDESPSENTSDQYSSGFSDSDSHPHLDSISDDEKRRRRDVERDIFDHPVHETLISNDDLCMPNSYSIQNNYASASPNYDSGTGPPPPPPPPAGNSSPWDFLNFFEAYEVPVAVYGKESNETEVAPVDEEGSGKNIQNKSSREEEKTIARISKKKVPEAKKEEDSKEVKAPGKSESCGADKRCVSEAMRELQMLFDKASESGSEFSKMFDSSKYRYCNKNSVSKVSNILYAVSPSFLGMSSHSSKSSFSLNTDLMEEDFTSSLCDFPSVLKKLCIWEKKLYQEIKEEEKMRGALKKSYKQLMKLEEKGTDGCKIESVRTSVRSLSTNITVAMHTIHKISARINRLRDDELCPQVKELLHRQFKMWKDLQKHHELLSRLLADNRDVFNNLPNGQLNDSHLESVLNLKLELQSWSLNLSNLLEAHRRCTKFLNEWLSTFLRQEPQGWPVEAPPLFLILKKWSEATERLSEDEFSEAVCGFSMKLSRLVEKHKAETKIVGEKEMDRKIMMLEKEDQKKFLQLVEMKKMKISAECVENSSLEGIFASMERFVDESKIVYEELIL